MRGVDLFSSLHVLHVLTCCVRTGFAILFGRPEAFGDDSICSIAGGAPSSVLLHLFLGEARNDASIAFWPPSFTCDTNQGMSLPIGMEKQDARICANWEARKSFLAGLKHRKSHSDVLTILFETAEIISGYSHASLTMLVWGKTKAL